MKKIVLCCSFGMSTSVLVRNMRKYIDEIGENIEVIALPIEKILRIKVDADAILLGPQVRFEIDNVNDFYSEIPATVIPIQEYGRLDGPYTVKLALDIMRKK